MTYEKSCGFIAYKEEDGTRLYLIIRSRGGEYGFPKGHMEYGETEYETAVRELKEETGAEVEIVEGFRRSTEYSLPKKANVIKQVVYFLGKCTVCKIVRQASEVSEATFVPFDEALKLLSFESTRGFLKEAEDFLSKGA